MMPSVKDILSKTISFSSQPTANRLAVIVCFVFCAAFTSVQIDPIVNPLKVISDTWLFEKIEFFSDVAFMFVAACALFHATIILLIILTYVVRIPLVGFFLSLLEIVVPYWLLTMSLFIIVSNLCQGNWVSEFIKYASDYGPILSPIIDISIGIGLIIDVMRYMAWIKDPQKDG